MTSHPSQPPEADDAMSRTRVTRLREKVRTDRADLDALLDSCLLGHFGLIRHGAPLVIPTAVVRDGERILTHGSTGAPWLRALAAGEPTCLTVTAWDGLVVARSAFESSMHYRSAMVFGTCSVVPAEEKVAALRAMSEAWMPGRWETLRPPTAKELAATAVLALPLVEWSVKISAGDPDDPPEDLDAPVWAGVLPIVASYGDPVPAPDLRSAPAVPAYLREWRVQ